MKKDACIQLNIPDHYLFELLEIDKGKEIGVEQRILIAIADYINRKKTRKNNKEHDQ